jgi:hypothetical protein
MAFGTREGHEHEVKWNTIDRRLTELGYRVKWAFNYHTHGHQYGIFRSGERQPMGIYEDEDTAQAMVKMILSNANDGG